MIPEDLMRKYKYGYVHSCEMLNEPFVKDLLKENQNLKKQLDDCKNGYKKYLNNQLSEDIEPDPEDFYLAEIEGKANDYDKLVAQQKEFIKYLEKRYKEINSFFGSYGSNTDFLHGRKAMTLEILSKYKEIIGSERY